MLSFMLSDQRRIKDNDVLEIAKALDVTPNELFGLNSEISKPVEITLRAEPEKIADFLTAIDELKNRKE